MKRILDYDPVTQITQWYHYDDITGNISLENVQDVTAIIEHNKSIFNQADERRPWTGDLHKVASIPNIIYVQLAKASNNFKDQKVIKRWLNDPDNKVFRTRPGRV